MGSQYMLSGASFNDASFPKLYDDERLTDGSLLLFDASHSLVGLTAPPAHGGLIRNVAAKTAAAIIGSGDYDSQSFEMYNTFDPSRGIFELTGKGALHGVVINGDQNGERAYIKTPTEIVEYITANPNRHYAIFIWSDVTRLTVNGNNMIDSIVYFNAASASSNSLGGAWLSNTIGPQRLSKDALTGMTGSPNSNAALNQGNVFAWGNAQPYDSINPDAGRSVVLYGFHLIDVEASGMTFDELEAADAALYQAAFAPGGRFYGDTYTDPDVLIPEA